MAAVSVSPNATDVVTEAASAAPSYKPRFCQFCEAEIPQKRMIATKGRATACVPCQEANGDVPKAKMFSESSDHGSIDTVYTDSNPYLERRRNTALGHLSPLTFLIAAGDDAHLRKPRFRENLGTERIDYDTEDRINSKIDSERKRK